MKISDLHSTYRYQVYRGRIAVLNGNNDTLYVFKDISLKRMDREDYSTFHKRKGIRIVYVSNKQLKTWTSDMGYVAGIRAIVMDRKAGTTYKSKYNSGSYLFCH